MVGATVSGRACIVNFGNTSSRVISDAGGLGKRGRGSQTHLRKRIKPRNTQNTRKNGTLPRVPGVRSFRHFSISAFQFFFFPLPSSLFSPRYTARVCSATLSQLHSCA